MDERSGGPAEPALWHDGWWESEDGLKLHFRDYPARDGAQVGGGTGGDDLPVLCIPGLTRNARDFEVVAQDLSPSRRVICIELRGRGESEYARDPASYNPMQYVADLDAFFAQTGIERAVFFGTSLGGIVTMLSALNAPDRIAGALLNDIGPVIESEGLDHIREYVGQGRSFPTWMHAARALQDLHGAVHPDWGIERWIAFAKQVMELGGSGNIRFDYDMRIADAFNDGDAVNGSNIVGADDLWPAFEALAGRPVLVVHGETSTILSAATAREMVGRIPAVELVTVPDTGHTPTLDEPPVREAISRLLARSR